MRIATWNINGIRARLDGAVQWTSEVRPDVLCFQEIKIEDAAFPRSAFEDLGYNVETHGQKSFNGVALLSKLPFDEVSRGLPGDDVRQPGAVHRRRLLDPGRRDPRRLALPAQRQPGRHRQVHLQVRLDGPARGLREGAARGRGDVRARRRLQRHPRADRRALPGPLGRGRAVPAGDPRRATAASSISGSPAPSAPARASRATTPSGTTRPAPGSGTTASGSTTSSSRRSPPTGSRAPRSTSARGAGTSRPTMSR